jgi:protein-tyrosine kinase
MGRVEEALRRAAEPKQGEPSVGVPDVLDIAFPTEGTDESLTVEPLTAEPLATEVLGKRLDPVDPRPTPRSALRSDRTPARGPDLKSDSPAETPLIAPAPTADRALSGSTKLVGDAQMLAVPREQYRRLAAALHHMQTMSGLKVILVASAMAGEGKTLTASNLALTFSDSYEREVLLIDADLRRPSLARTFGISPSPGLSDGLGRDFQGSLALQHVSERLTILPAGRAMPDPMAGLTSGRMKQLIAEAREAFDWVIIDTPPIGLMADANLLSAIADGVVLVVKANATPYDLVKRAIDALGPNHVLGAVLNRTTVTPKGTGYYDYYHYAPAPEGAAKKK